MVVADVMTPAANWTEPLWPMMTSSPEPPLIWFEPKPPMMTSKPGPPVIVSMPPTVGSIVDAEVTSPPESDAMPSEPITTSLVPPEVIVF